MSDNNEPKWKDLKVSVDKFFLQVDNQNEVTLRDAYNAVEAEQDAPLSKPTKKRVRNHLADLIQGTVKPQVVDLPFPKHFRTSNDECLLVEKPEILMVLVRSGCLTDKEMARLFLLTAKAVTNHAVVNIADGTDEWVWKQLCLRKWGPNSTKNKLRHTGWTHKQFYRKFALKLDDKKAKPQPKLELEYLPQDYTVIVELRGPCGMDVCKSFPGDRIKELFQKGKATVEYESPLWKGKMPTCLAFRPVVNILRRPDNELVEIGSEGLDLCLDIAGGELEVDVYDEQWVEGQEMVLRKPGLRQVPVLSVRVDVWPICKKIKSNQFGIFGFVLQGKFIVGDGWDCEEEDADDVLRLDGHKHQFAHYLECIEGFVTF